MSTDDPDLVKPRALLLTPHEIAYVRRLMWQLPKWDEQEAAFHERLEKALNDGQ